MTEHLLIRLLALFVLVALTVVARSNGRGERFAVATGSRGAHVLHAILVFAAVALVELIVWALAR
jgi:hypothetical protein